MSAEMKFPDFDIAADIKFLSTSEGGRKTPALSSYRPNHDFGLESGLVDAVHEYIGIDRAEPGGSVYAHLVFLSPNLLKGKLSLGQTFRVQEGAKLIALGTISKIFSDELRNDS